MFFALKQSCLSYHRLEKKKRYTNNWALKHIWEVTKIGQEKYGSLKKMFEFGSKMFVIWRLKVVHSIMQLCGIAYQQLFLKIGQT